MSTKPFKRFSLIVFLRYVLMRFKHENVLSGSAVVTGKVASIRSSVRIFRKSKVISIASNTLLGDLFMRCSPLRHILSWVTMVEGLLSGNY